MNGCELYAEQISAYVDGELPGDVARMFAAHLGDCADCTTALAAAEQVDRALRTLPELEPSAGFEAALRARLAAEPAPSPSPARASARGRGARHWLSQRLIASRPLEWGLAAAAALLLAVVLSQSNPALPEADWEVVASAESFDLLTSQDHELLYALELLESWDGSEEI